MARYIDVDKLNLDAEVEMADDWKTAHEIANVIKYAPAEDVTPLVHAHWKDGCCTNCRTPKFVMKVVRGFDEVVYEYEGEANYCPNCGAKMEKEE